MRRVSGILLILLLILGMASPALAADYDLPNVPILRGSAQPPRSESPNFQIADFFLGTFAFPYIA